MRRAAIELENRRMANRQREFRAAADVVADAWMEFPEVAAIAVIGSVARKLWKEVPRFSEFRRERIEIWHECGDLDLALWLDGQEHLSELRTAAARALRAAFETGKGISVVSHQLDAFLIEPATNHYLGRLCHFNECPKGKRECEIPGCGDIPFNRRFPDFSPSDDLLAPAEYAMLYRRGQGRLQRAQNLPSVEAE
jgi:hypothetical protein